MVELTPSSSEHSVKYNCSFCTSRVISTCFLFLQVRLTVDVVILIYIYIIVYEYMYIYPPITAMSVASRQQEWNIQPELLSIEIGPCFQRSLGNGTAGLISTRSPWKIGVGILLSLRVHTCAMFVIWSLPLEIDPEWSVAATAGSSWLRHGWSWTTGIR